MSGEETLRGKTRPDIFLKAAELLGIPQEDCVVIEDCHNVLTAAREAGIKSVGFRNPNSGNQSLELDDKIVDGFSEITFDLLMGLVAPVGSG